jgi:hypothetical protein
MPAADANHEGASKADVAGSGGTGGMMDRSSSPADEAQERAVLVEDEEPEFDKDRWDYKFYLLLEDPRSSSGAWIVSMLQITLIFLSIVALVLETEPALKWVDKTVWSTAELISTSLFTVEYLARLFVARYAEPKAKYPYIAFVFRVANIFDLLAIMPLYLEAGMGQAGAEPFRVLRIVRLPRVFKVFKMGKYSEGLILITEGLKRSSQALQLMVFVMTVGMIVFASLFYLFEEGTLVNNVYVFSTIPDACWFVFVTFTTAGFGDAYPQRPMGYFLAVVTMLLGIVLLAMPISIIGQKFTQVYKELQRRNMDHSAQTQELRVLLSTLCAILAEVEELAGELETANQAVVHDVIALAQDIVGVSVAAPSQKELSFHPKKGEPSHSGSVKSEGESAGLFANKED